MSLITYFIRLLKATPHKLNPSISIAIWNMSAVQTDKYGPINFSYAIV